MPKNMDNFLFTVAAALVAIFEPWAMFLFVLALIIYGRK